MNRIFIFISCLSLFLTAQPASAELLRLETKTKLRGVYFLPTENSGRIIVHPVIVAGEADFDGPHGLSHYLEHVMYWHANKINDKVYHGRGGNAWVNGLITSYYNTGGRAELDDMFEFAKRILTPPTLDEKFMLDERDVVVREYDFRLSENPDWRMWDAIWAELLPDNPSSRSVIGTPQSIKSLTLDHVRSFHKQHYHPANMVLLVTGNLKPQEVVRLTERAFGNLPAGNHSDQSWRQEPQKGRIDEKLVLKDRYVVFPTLAKAAVADWPGTGKKGTDQAVLLLADALMSSALDGSLSKPLRIDNFVFSAFSASFFSRIDGQAQFFFSGNLDKRVSHSAADKAFTAAFEEIVETGIPVKSLDRVRKRLVRKIMRQTDDARFVLNGATDDLSFGIMPQTAETRIEHLNSVTKQQIDELLKAVLNADRWATAHLKPEES